MRTAVNEATGYSPYFLNTGRHYNSSGNDYSLSRRNVDSSIPEDRERLVAARSTMLSETFDNVRRRMKATYDRNLTQYNRGKTKLIFQVGDVVWKRNHVLSDATKHSTKLAPRYVKCRVVDKKSDLVYLLENMDGQFLGAWHLKDLKPDQ
jgi:hypothetical protein